LIQVAARNTTIKRIVVTGTGRNFLARKAAIEAGFTDIIDLGEVIGGKGADISPAYAMALMVATLKEKQLRKQK
ncbi:MAG: hypothetical protein QW279_06720, partial [Candidatus Jordarchaeaceae archaeon]